MAIVFSLSAAAQNQYYVSTSGSDSNNGTSPNTAWKTINHAIAAFSVGGSGAVINVTPGQYNGQVNINRGGSSSSVRLVLKCTQQWSVPSSAGCKLRNAGGGDNIMSVTANNIDVGADNQFGFDMSNPALSYAITLPCNIPTGSTGNCSTGNSVHILGNYIHDLSSSISSCEVNPNGHPAISFNNHHGPYMSDAQVIGNRITNIGSQSLSKLNGGPGCYNYYAMYIETHQATVQNNVIANIAGYGVHYYSSPCQGNISNNTIQRTEFPNIIVGGGDCNNGVPQGNVTVSNNILGQTGPGWQNLVIGVPGGGGVGSSAHPILVTNNIFSGGSAGQTLVVGTSFTSIQNSKTEAPTTTFVNYTGGNNDDFHLKAGSVAIANGTSSCVSGGKSPCVPKFDIVATIRLSNPSLGAYEDSSGEASAPAAPTGLTAQVQ